VGFWWKEEEGLESSSSYQRKARVVEDAHLLVTKFLEVLQSVDDDVRVEEGSRELEEGEVEEACVGEGGSVAEAKDRSFHLDGEGGRRMGALRASSRRHRWKN